MMRKSVWLAYFLCLFGFFLSVYLFYPGYLSPDSWWQLQQAETFHFSNWHPPVMALLWHVFLLWFPLVQASVSMLVLQLLFFWVALAVFVAALSVRAPRFIWVLPLLGFIPPVLIFNGVLWKDIQMGNAFLLVFALLLFIKQVQSVYFKASLLFIIMLLSFYGFCLRFEALFACIPLFYLIALFFERVQVLGRLVFVFMMLVLFFGVRVFMEDAIHTQNLYPAQQIMFYDLASMSIMEHQMLIPLDNCVVQVGCYQMIQKHYDPTLVDYIINGKPLQKLTSLDQYQELSRAWMHAILARPFLYLHERLVFFKDILPTEPLVFPSHYEVISSDPFHVQAPKVWVSHFFRIYQFSGVILNLFFWIVVGILTLVLLYCHRKSMDIWFYSCCQSMVISGLLLWLSHLIVAAAYDFRYYYWTMLTALFGFTFVLLVDFFKKDEFDEF